MASCSPKLAAGTDKESRGSLALRFKGVEDKIQPLLFLVYTSFTNIMSYFGFLVSKMEIVVDVQDSL